jgi:hypothetical protein
VHNLETGKIEKEVFMTGTDSNSRPSFFMLIIEITLIVFGVLLGLWANEWLIERENKANADHALEYIRSEMQRNKEQLEKIIPSHKAVRDSLNAIGSKTMALEQAHVSASQFWGVMKMSVPVLEHTGWQLAVQTGAINHIDFNLASKISQLYNVQSFCTGKIDRLSDNFYIASNMNTHDFTNLAFVMMLLFNDIVIQEERLIDVYGKFLEKTAPAVPH